MSNIIKFPKYRARRSNLGPPQRKSRHLQNISNILVLVLSIGLILYIIHSANR